MENKFSKDEKIASQESPDSSQLSKKSKTDRIIKIILGIALIAGLIFAAGFIFKNNLIDRTLNKGKTLTHFLDEEGPELDFKLGNFELRDGEYRITYYINGIEETNIKKSVVSSQEHTFETPQIIAEKLEKIIQEGNSAEVKIVIAWSTGREELVKTISRANSQKE